MKKKTKIKSNTGIVLTFMLILIYSLSVRTAIPQPQTEWVARYNSPENYNDTITDMEIDKIGNVYILGYNSYNFFTLKYNNDGVLKWVGKYRGPSIYQGRASDMVLDDSGNVYVTGFTYTGNQSPYKKEIVIIKYSPNGDTSWTKRYLNVDSVGAEPVNILIADSNNIYITGKSFRWQSNQDINILKYNSSGIRLLEKFYGGHFYDNISSSITDLNNNLYILGGVVQSNVKIIKYDILGNITKEISDTVQGYKIYIDNNYNIITSGYSSTDTTLADIGTSKYDSSGQKMWFTYYNNNSFMKRDFFRDFTIDCYGNLFVTGVSTTGMEIAWDIVTIKYNQDGDSLWVQRYDSIYNSSDDPASIAVDHTGNVYVAGYTNFNLLANWYITICYDSTGNQKFVLFYNNVLPYYGHEAKSVKKYSAGNIYVYGVSQNSNGDYDIATIKYNILSSINPISNIIPKDSKLYQNYPNPFNSMTKIRFAISRAGIIELEVYDILGRKLQTLFKGYKTAGIYEIDFDSHNLSSGI